MGTQIDFLQPPAPRKNRHVQLTCPSVEECTVIARMSRTQIRTLGAVLCPKHKIPLRSREDIRSLRAPTDPERSALCRKSITAYLKRADVIYPTLRTIVAKLYKDAPQFTEREIRDSINWMIHEGSLKSEDVTAGPPSFYLASTRATPSPTKSPATKPGQKPSPQSSPDVNDRPAKKKHAQTPKSQRKEGAPK